MMRGKQAIMKGWIMELIEYNLLICLQKFLHVESALRRKVVFTLNSSYHSINYVGNKIDNERLNTT